MLRRHKIDGSPATRLDFFPYERNCLATSFILRPRTASSRVGEHARLAKQKWKRVRCGKL